MRDSKKEMMLSKEMGKKSNPGNKCLDDLQRDTLR